MVIAHVGLGANLGDPAAQVRSALDRLAREPQLRLTAQSHLYRSAPIGEAGQPDYCNAACSLETALSPLQLLDLLRRLETELGRSPATRRWGPRHLDLDLLLYGDQVIADAGIAVPHPQMHRRNFVLVPLAEIAPDAVVPGHGRVAQLAAAAGMAGLARWP